MGDLLVIVNEKNDIVYRQAYDVSGENEYFRLIMELYGALDLLCDEMRRNGSDYFECLEMVGNKKISACIVPSGYKMLLVHSKGDVRGFFTAASELFTRLFVHEYSDGAIDDPEFEREMERAYSAVF
jgi:hypothetical protein